MGVVVVGDMSAVEVVVVDVVVKAVALVIMPEVGSQKKKGK